MLAVVQAAAVCVLIRERWVSAGLRRTWARLQAHWVDEESSLLVESAMPLRLHPELEWAQIDEVQVGVIVFSPPPEAVGKLGHALRSALRGYENAFRLDDYRLLVALWNVDEAGLANAVERLGEALLATGLDELEVGSAMFPVDGEDTFTLIECAIERSWWMLAGGAPASQAA